MGNVPGSNNPNVPFQNPSNPLQGVDNISVDTNAGRETESNTAPWIKSDRKMPCSWGGSNDAEEAAPFKGVGLNPEGWGGK